MAQKIGNLMVHLSGLFFRKTVQTTAFEQGNFVALVHEGHELLRLTGEEQGRFLHGEPFQCPLGTVTITPTERRGESTPAETMLRLMHRFGPQA